MVETLLWTGLALPGLIYAARSLHWRWGREVARRRAGRNGGLEILSRGRLLASTVTLIKQGIAIAVGIAVLTLPPSSERGFFVLGALLAYVGLNSLCIWIDDNTDTRIANHVARMEGRLRRAGLRVEGVVDGEQP